MTYSRRKEKTSPLEVLGCAGIALYIAICLFFIVVAIVIYAALFKFAWGYLF